MYLVHLKRGCLLSFTKREMKLLYDSYFEVIREMEKYIEVKSVNTEHCWNVFKHTFESGRHVTLYHKHSMNKPYYYKQCSCRTVVEAVERIKQHDEYELKRREVSVLQKFDTLDRRLKVYKSNDKDNNSGRLIIVVC